MLEISEFDMIIYRSDITNSRSEEVKGGNDKGIDNYK